MCYKNSKNILLSYIGSETTGSRILYFPFCEPPKNAWKHNLTAFKSIEVWLSLCENPAEKY